MTQEQATQTIADLLQQWHDLGVAWAQEMLGSLRAISIGSGMGSLWDRAKAIVAGIVDRVDALINGVEVAQDVDPEVAIEDAVTQVLISMPGMIAGTEMQTVIQDGVYSTLASAANAPDIVWVTSPGACFECLAYEAMGVVPLGTDFGGNAYPPAHPNCRCHLDLVAGGQA